MGRTPEPGNYCTLFYSRKTATGAANPTLARYFQRLCAAQGTVVVRKLIKHPRPVLVAAARLVPTPRNAAWLVLRRTKKHSADDRALLADLRRHAPGAG